MPPYLVRHALIHVFLTLCFFLPGGLLWNRVSPHIAGFPLSVFVETLALPFLIAVNLLLFFLACLKDDQSLMSRLDRGERIAGESETGSDTGT